MSQKDNLVSASETIILLLVFSNVVILKTAFIDNENWYLALIVTLPLLLISIYYVHQKKDADGRYPSHED